MTKSKVNKNMFEITDIISWIKKNITKKDIIFIVLIISAYFLTRLIFLDHFPIFCDEGIYIHWAKVAWHDATWRFISLTDGKQPLQTWGTIPYLKMFPDNALLAGRLFSVTTGLFALSGIFSLLYYLFGKKTALIGSLFYVFTPYYIFYDRLALVDSGVNAGFIWMIFFSILLARNRKLDLALIFGLVAGFSLLAKSSVRLFLGLSALAPILFFEKNIKRFISKSINFFILFGVVSGLALLIYNVQRLSPFFQFVSEKNKTFVMTFSEFIETPFKYFTYNIWSTPLYIAWESGFVISIIGLLGFYLLFKKNKNLFLYFFLWFILPFIAVVFFTKVLYPRYIIFFATLLIILAAYFVSQIKNKKVLITTYSLFFLSVLYFNYTIIFDYKNIPLPPVDRGQYLEAWPAGWGIKESVEYAREKSKEKPVIILAEGNFGVAGDVLDVMLKRNDRITIKGYWPLDIKELTENQKELKKYYIFVVFSHRMEFPKEWPIKLIQKYDKPGLKAATYLFELTE